LGYVLINWNKLLGEIVSNMFLFCVAGVAFCVFLFFIQCKSLIKVNKENIEYQKDSISIQNVLYASLMIMCLLSAWFTYQYFYQ